jgi:dipeptidyl aminopeptidase/acylaminoacyl peptidase
MRKHIFLLLLLMVSAGAALAQAPQRLTPELLWKMGRVSLDDVSPDGTLAVYGVTYYNLAENKGNRDLFVVPVSGGPSRKVTAFPGSEGSAQFRPDGKKIGFISGSQLWEMNPDGTDARQVSSISGGIGGFKYAPTGNAILYIRDVKLDKTTQEVYPDLPLASAHIIDDLMYRHWNQWHDYAYSHVFVAPYSDGKIETASEKDLLSGEAFDSPVQPFGGMEEVAWSPNGFFVAYTSKKVTGKDFAVSTNSDIYLYDLQGEKTTNLSEGNPGYDKEPVFSPDGKSLIWTSMARAGFEADRTRIIHYDLQTSTKKELTAGFDQEANHPKWSPDGKEIYFISGKEATYQLYALEVATGKIRAITSGDHDYTAFAVTPKSLVATKMNISMPAELFAVEIKSGKETALTEVNKELLSRTAMGKVESRWVDATDGGRIKTWVIYPPDFDPNKKYPTLLYCQGGPQSAVSQFFSFRWNFQLMAANGYIVVAPNRRGLPSFGQRWNDQISGDWGGQAMQDYLSAIDAVAQEPYVDKEKLGAVGASFGGFSVYWLAGNHNKRFKAFISHCGLFNMESWYGSTEELFFANHDLKGPYWDPAPNPTYLIHSPHLYVKKWDTPILVIHGEKDFRVPVTEGIQAFQAAQLQDIPSRFLYFPDEGHWVMQPQNGVLWHREFFRWLDQWLK